MSERYSILDLSKLVKQARENCILGLYEKALNKYEIAIPIIESSKSVKSNISKLSSADSDIQFPEEYLNKNIKSGKT